MSEPRYEAPVAPPQHPARSLLDQLQELLASVNADLADLAGLGAELGPARGSASGVELTDGELCDELEASGARRAADRSGATETGTGAVGW